MCQQQGYKQESWSSGLKMVKTCGLHEEETPKPVIYMAYSVYCNILAMCKHMGSLEWLGYLLGKREKDGNYSVSGIIIPDQEVTGTSVDEIAEVEPLNIIGTVHSHGNMGAFFSGIDEGFIGSNHPVMVVFGGNTTKQQVRKKLLCGAFIILEAELVVFDPNYKGADKFVRDNVDKIKKKVITYSPYYMGEGGLYLPEHWG